MSAFDKIIGYDGVKERLARTADVLAHPEEYAKLGARAPKGLLIYGDPGLGKTLMARCLIEESGRTAFTCRKDKPSGKIIKYIKRTFEEAVEAAPSIVFLDDLDKFANEDSSRSDAEEYVTVQACMDELGEADVFVLATANKVYKMPHSLVRQGRLGDRIRVDCPVEADAAAIMTHYLEGKGVGAVDGELLGRLLEGHSCAELEEVMNEAALIAGYERCSEISMSHLVKAVFRSIYRVQTPTPCAPGLNGRERTRRLHAAYHEAAHVTTHEALDPGSVVFSALYPERYGQTGGQTRARRSDGLSPFMVLEADALASLASKAALEQRFGVADSGVTRDLDDAFEAVRRLVGDLCTCGFALHTEGSDDSPALAARIEEAAASEVERYYRRAKEILAANGRFLDAVAKALFDNGMVTMRDIERIAQDVPLTPAA